MVSIFKWSIADWHELVESGILADRRVELLEGEIVEINPKEPMHSSTNYSVVEYLKELLRNQAVIREAHPITLDNSEPEPDVAVVAVPYTNYFTRHPYPQDIYWVIDLVNKQLIVHTQPINNSYSQVRCLAAGTVTPQAFPQIAIALDKLLLF